MSTIYLPISLIVVMAWIKRHITEVQFNYGLFLTTNPYPTPIPRQYGYA
jgi:hypothetical protein